MRKLDALPNILTNLQIQIQIYPINSHLSWSTLQWVCFILPFSLVDYCITNKNRWLKRTIFLLNLQFGQVLVGRRSLLHTASIPWADSVGTGGSGGGGDEDLPRQLLLLAHKTVLPVTCLRDLSKEVCESSVAQSCPTFCDPMDCSLPDSSICGIFQVRILEWVAISFSRGSSQSRDGTCVSCIFCIGRQILYH